MFCDYGCGNIANYTLKNGKHCCSSNIAKCPSIRKRIKENHANSKEIYKNLPDTVKERMKWNKGKTKETDIRVKEQAERTQEKYKKGILKPSFTGRKHTEETKQKISKNTSRFYNYNADRKSGRGKKGYYKGYWCDSTYELAYIIYCLDNNIIIKRNKEYFEYEYNGNLHRYYPDFIVNDTIIEIKGYADDKLRYKEEALKISGKKYKILFYEDLQDIFNYIKIKYDKDIDKNIHELYE